MLTQIIVWLLIGAALFVFLQDAAWSLFTKEGRKQESEEWYRNNGTWRF